MGHEDDVVPNWLEALKGDQPYQTPPAYFRQLTQEVLEKTQPRPTSARGWESLVGWFRLKRWNPSVAIVVILLAGLGLFWWQAASTSRMLVEDQWTSEEIENYLLANLDHLDERLLFDQELSPADWMQTALTDADETLLLRMLHEENDEMILREIF